MTIFYPARNNIEKISFEDFIDVVGSSVDFDDPESICAVAPLMQGLSVDNGWFIDYLNSELSNNFSGDAVNFNHYSSNSFVLKRGEGYMIRANLWLPSDDELRLVGDGAVFAEDLLHDHNFNLLTLGLFGSGYETEIFEYEFEDCVGLIGEEVNASGPSLYKLDKGSCLFMERGRTIHRQIAPKDLSLSLNLMSQTKASVRSRQYGFEETGGVVKISSIHYDTSFNPSASESLINIMGTFFNESTKDLIVSVYERVSLNPDANEQLILQIVDWCLKRGISFDVLKPIPRMSRHLRERMDVVLESHASKVSV